MKKISKASRIFREELSKSRISHVQQLLWGDGQGHLAHSGVGYLKGVVGLVMSGVFDGEGMLVAFDCDGKAGKRPLVGDDICTLGAAGLEAELCDDYIQMND